MRPEEFKQFVAEQREERRKQLEREKVQKAANIFNILEDSVFKEMKDYIERFPESKTVFIGTHDMAHEYGLKDLEEVNEAIVVSLISLSYSAKLVHVEDGNYYLIEVDWGDEK